MNSPEKTVERLFPFIKRARTLMVGQHIIHRSKSQLHFLLITHDISSRSRSEILRKFKHYPIVQHYRSTDLEKHFELKGTKLVGFRKSGLSKSLYTELKPYRINEPVRRQEPEALPPSPRRRPIPPRKRSPEPGSSKRFQKKSPSKPSTSRHPRPRSARSSRS